MNKLIHIVGTNMNSVVILAKRLHSFLYDTEIFNNSDSLVDALNRATRIPDLILVDIINNSPTYMQIPSLIKSKTKFAAYIPCAAISCLHERGLVMQTLQNGYSDYIIRPMELEIFQDRIRTLIEKIPDINSVTFRAPLHERGIVEFQIELEQFNEFGVSAKSKMQFPKNFMLTLKSPIFEKNGFAKLDLRVDSAQANALKSGEYDLVLSYIGLDATQIRQLRLMAINMNGD